MSELTAEDLSGPRSFAARFGMAPVSNLVERFGGHFVSKRLEGSTMGSFVTRSDANFIETYAGISGAKRYTSQVSKG
ncbi:MAG: hypothetical protein ACLSTO_09565 [Bilophila wadsworthia]